jgi:hypothetical protein
MRLINADALKEKIDNIWNGRPLSFLGAKILAMIDHEPTIDAEWIPCSERLPSERELVLISDNNYVYPAVFHPNGVYDGKTVWSEYYWTDLETGIIQSQPDAWMPLPKPYREENEA